MALIVADRVQETSTTTGTGAFTLLGATTGYRSASTVCANGDTFTYYAEDIDVSGRPLGGWETGLGTWGTGNILTRTTVYASSNAGAAVSWAAGTRKIGLGLVATAALGNTTATSINSTPIGGTTPAAGSFTTLGASGAIATTTNLQVNRTAGQDAISQFSSGASYILGVGINNSGSTNAYGGPNNTAYIGTIGGAVPVVVSVGGEVSRFSSTGLAVIGGISTNQSIAVTNTTDYATLSLTGQLLSWISLSVPGNDSYWLRNGSGGVFRIENATQSTSPFEIVNPGAKKLVINGSGATITGDVSTGSTAADAYFKLTEATVLKASFRWDYGNGAAWIGTDIAADVVIKYNGAEKARILSSGMSVSGTASATSNTVSAVSSSGYGFWGTGPIAYGILMAASADTTYGGRISGETTSDYNMYFTMTQGSNRGFVFRNAYSTPLLSINSDAIRSNVGVTISGALQATTKSFLINHPLKEGKKLRYGSLEGPEHGVYCRGRLKGNVIDLPDYWTALVDPDSITVQLTPVGQHQKLYVKDISNNQVIVGSENLFGSIDCFYIVNAERRDIASLIVEE